MVDKVNNDPQFLTTEIFDAVHHVMHMLRSRQYAVFKNCPFPLTHMEGKALAIIGNTPGTTLSDLVARSGRDKGQLARLIKTLKEQGLVRSEPDPKDKRSTRLFLTEKGQTLNAMIQKELETATEIAVASVSQDDRTHLLTLLNCLKAGLEKENA